MREELRRLAQAIREFRSHDPHGSLLTLQTYLNVATRGPITPARLAHRLSVSGPTMTNALQRLSGNNPKHRPRQSQKLMQLISLVPHPNHKGSKLAMLDAEGASLAVRMGKALGVKDT